MNTSDVIRRFGQMANLSVPEASEQANLANVVITMMKGNLKDKEMEEENDRLLVNVCAATMNYWYQLSKATSQPAGQMEAGGMSIANDLMTDIAAARTLKDEWWSVASHLLKDPNFVFMLMPEDKKPWEGMGDSPEKDHSDADASDADTKEQENEN